MRLQCDCAPLIVLQMRLGQELDRALRWQTKRWELNDSSADGYLLNAVGRDAPVVAEQLGGLNRPDYKTKPDPIWAVQSADVACCVGGAGGGGGSGGSAACRCCLPLPRATCRLPPAATAKC